jgi:hypothetical protein
MVLMVTSHSTGRIEYAHGMLLVINGNPAPLGRAISAGRHTIR